MRDRVPTLRLLAVTASLAFAAMAAPASAFADDEARRAILDLRQQVQQQNEQNVRARLQLADQLQSLQQEIAQLRNQLELVSRQQPSTAQQGQQQNNHPGNPPGVSAADPQEQAAYDGAWQRSKSADHCSDKCFKD